MPSFLLAGLISTFGAIVSKTMIVNGYQAGIDING
jgi:hypothetical protein